MNNALSRAIQNIWFKLKYAGSGISVTVVKPDPRDKTYMLDMITGEIMKDDCPLCYVEEQKKFLDDCHANVEIFVENEKGPGDILLSLSCALEIAHQKTNDRVIEYSVQNLLREYYNKGLLDFTPSFMHE